MGSLKHFWIVPGVAITLSACGNGSNSKRSLEVQAFFEAAMDLEHASENLVPKSDRKPLIAIVQTYCSKLDEKQKIEFLTLAVRYEIESAKVEIPDLNLSDNFEIRREKIIPNPDAMPPFEMRYELRIDNPKYLQERIYFSADYGLNFEILDKPSMAGQEENRPED